MNKHFLAGVVILGVALVAVAVLGGTLIPMRNGIDAGTHAPHMRGEVNPLAEPVVVQQPRGSLPLAATTALAPKAQPISLLADNTGENTGLEPGEEPTPPSLPGAFTIPMHGRAELLVIPVDPNKPRAEQIEWCYLPMFHVKDVQYDAAQRLLKCRIDASLSSQTRDRIYAELREKTGAPAQTAFRLNPVRVQSITIELHCRNKKLVVSSTQAGHDLAFGVIPFTYPVTDDEVHDSLSTCLQYAKLHVHTTSPYTAFARASMQVDYAVSAVRDAVEKVLPKGMTIDELEKHPLVVDREAALKLQQALREEFRIRVEGNPTKLAAFEQVFDRLLSRITVSEVPLHHLTADMIDRCLFWNHKTQGLEGSPDQRTTMTKALEEAAEKRTAFNHAWDTMREESSKASDAEAWHNTLYEKMKLDARLKVGIAVFSGSASMNLEKEFNKSDEGSRQASREAFAKMKNAGAVTKEEFEKSYRKFQGDDWAASVRGKILHINKVAQLNVLSSRSAIIEYVKRETKSLCERVSVVPLEVGNTQEVDVLEEIRQLKQKQPHREWIPNAEAEIRKKALATIETEIKKANEDLSAAQATREGIRADNKPHEDRLAALKVKMVEADAAYNTASAEYDAAKNEYSRRKGYPLGTILFGFSADDRDYVDLCIGQLSANAHLMSLQANLLHSEAEDREADLQPGRARLAAAEHRCEARKAILANLEAKRAALIVLIQHEP